MRYLVANLNGDVSFLSPSIASSEELHSSQPASSMELEMSYRHSPRSIVRLSSANSGSPKSSQALASAVPQPSPPLSSAAHSCPQPPVALSEGIFNVEVFSGTLKDLPEGMQVVVLGEGEVEGAQLAVQQDGGEHPHEQHMVSRQNSSFCRYKSMSCENKSRGKKA